MSQDSWQWNPSLRLQYEGERHPVTGDVVVRQDMAGYRAAWRDIARGNPKHPALQDVSLWPKGMFR